MASVENKDIANAQNKLLSSILSLVNEYQTKTYDASKERTINDDNKENKDVDSEIEDILTSIGDTEIEELKQTLNQDTTGKYTFSVPTLSPFRPLFCSIVLLFLFCIYLNNFIICSIQIYSFSIYSVLTQIIIKTFG